MKDLKTLLAEVRDDETLAYLSVKEEWDKYYGKTDKWPYEYNFKHIFNAHLEGHKAACSVLIPALEEAINCLRLSGSSSQFKEGDYGYQFILIARQAEDKIRQILESANPGGGG